MKIVTIIGARPQFIKAAVVSRLLAELPGVEEVLVHTGQHYDESMSDIFFQELAIPKPAFHLGVGSGAHGAQTGRMLEAIERVLLNVRPDAVLIYGDTNSTLAGALAAVKLHIPVAHVEAGLRSFNRRMPEEINRVTADHLSAWLFAPTTTAVDNLRNEGIAAEATYLVGDVMYDAAIYYGDRAPSDTLARHGLAAKQYVLATVHRAENTDSPARLAALFDALQQISAQIPVVLPIHPRTRAALARQHVALDKASNLHLLAPLGYLDMVALEKHALLIATDSGGVQKEAFFHRVPCVTLRDETEWTELVSLGWNRLAPPTDAGTVFRAVMQAIDGAAPAVPESDPYGGGQAGERITATLASRAA